MPEENFKRIHGQALEVLQAGKSNGWYITKCKVAKVVGLFNFAAIACPYGCFLLVYLYECLNSKSGWNAKVRINSPMPPCMRLLSIGLYLTDPPTPSNCGPHSCLAWALHRQQYYGPMLWSRCKERTIKQEEFWGAMGARQAMVVNAMQRTSSHHNKPSLVCSKGQGPLGTLVVRLQGCYNYGQRHIFSRVVSMCTLMGALRFLQRPLLLHNYLLAAI